MDYRRRHCKIKVMNLENAGINLENRKHVKISKVRGEVRNLKKKSGSSKYQSFGSHLKKSLQTSLITSFPEIASRNSWTKRVIKIAVFITCLAGFVYQTMDFLRLYWAYPTIVNVNITNPFRILQPAITVCNHNRRRRSFICSVPGNNCTFPELNSTFCEQYPRYCPLKDPRRAFSGLPSYWEALNDALDWNATYLASHSDKMITDCFWMYGHERKHCRKPYARIPVVDARGKSNTCYSIESLVGKPDENDSLYPNTLKLSLNMYTLAEEYASYLSPVMVQVNIHDRRAVTNPFSDGVALEAGKEYYAFVSMKTQELLPPPYDTECFDYLETWKKNNGTGPLNQLMCLQYCQIKKLTEMGKCINRLIDYPHESPLCKQGEETSTCDIVENCSLECKRSCYDRYYDVQYKKIGAALTVCSKYDEWCSGTRIQLRVFFNRFRLTRYIYQPKFASVEVFSYIGGYMGMWLGISLISLFDFFETVCSMLYYPVRRLNIRAKRNFVNPAVLLQ